MRSVTKYKSISHWFSYNWGWLLGGALLVLFIVYTTVFQPMAPKSDYTITWVGRTLLSDAESEAISAAVTRAGSDQNRDGMVTVAVNQYVIDFTVTGEDYNYEDNYANFLKLLAEIQAKECYLFLMDDPELLQYSLGVLQYLDGTIPGEEDHYACANWEQMCVLWQPEGLEHQAYLGRRAFFGGEETQKLFPGADALFTALAGIG